MGIPGRDGQHGHCFVNGGWGGGVHHCVVPELPRIVGPSIGRAVGYQGTDVTWANRNVDGPLEFADPDANRRTRRRRASQLSNVILTPAAKRSVPQQRTRIGAARCDFDGGDVAGVRLAKISVWTIAVRLTGRKEAGVARAAVRGSTSIIATSSGSHPPSPVPAPSTPVTPPLPPVALAPPLPAPPSAGALCKVEQLAENKIAPDTPSRPTFIMPRIKVA